jgi:hypothetical protein
MSAFFDSLRSDLLDRRLTPLLALLGAALLGAIVYAALAGGSSSPAPTAPSVTPKTPGIAVSAVTTKAKTAVAETTSGASQQTGGHSRNPFAPLPGAKSSAAAPKTSSGAGSTAAVTPSGEGSSSTGSSGSSQAETTSPSQTGGAGGEQKKTAKPAKTYKVSILFGTAPAGTPPLTAGLTSYESLQRQQPLPSAKEPLIVFRGVVVGGRSATFTLVGEAILRGSAACRPSASQCQAIDLKAGDSEELEYVPLGGTAVTYELYVVKIEAVKAKAGGSASVASAGDPASAPRGESKAGRAILRAAGLTALPGMRYSSDGSVLVFEQPEHALAARAHAAAWGAVS